ncbi:LVIVD repeat-containing protein [Kibdelosporangium phytohabitans]|uniref:Uncharacterized protein n=1 Tax=Kibdelosporangium phytohabitans TaxID=860235 RepID=A0A0N7F3L8_9PSEU|nr:hypothetical protein AOZ06_20580 [Kibdelosporangium phytohabitans]
MRRWLFGSTVAMSAVALMFVSTVPAQACGDEVFGNPGNPSSAAHAGHTGPKAEGLAATSAVKNVDLVANVPDAAGATSVRFLKYGHKDVLFVSGTFGLKSYDVDNPRKPKLLGEVKLPGFWQGEDTEVDEKRKLVFLARDPRAYGGNTQTGESGIYTVDAKRPDKLEVVSYVKVPAGHTTSCVNDCRYVWTGGPAKADNQPADWGGRPIWVTDMSNPRKPKVFPNPIDLYRNDGKTDYAHDVQVDALGIAWSSGRGGVRGYWTEGWHRDPVTGKFRRATALDPVPYAGGGVNELAAPSKFMHNSYRPVGWRQKDGGDHERWGRNGDLIYATEESFLDGCAGDGVLVIASLKGSYNGEGWRSTPDKPFRLKTIGSWSVAGQEGSDPASGDCSAHYFDVEGKILVQSFYAQGTRFIDISDPTNPRQIAYHRPGDGRSWYPAWHKGYVFVADNLRGIDILKLSR